jgi:hypothetical protein
MLGYANSDSDVHFKNYVKSNLARSLAEEIMLHVKVPIPVLRDDIIEYDLRFSIGTASEPGYYKRLNRELNAWKEMFPHNQVLVDKRLLGEDIEELLGK